MEGWHEFYLLIGTAGLTLTGLLFVVVSLGPRVVASHEATGVRAFISPNAVYFTTTLVVSAILMIPHLSVLVSGGLLSLGALGVCGLPFPYVPQQVTLLNWLTIGFPALIIALSRERSSSATRGRKRRQRRRTS